MSECVSECESESVTLCVWMGECVRACVHACVCLTLTQLGEQSRIWRPSSDRTRLRAT